MLVQRLHINVDPIRNAWVEKCLNRMQDHVRIGKQNNSYADGGASQGEDKVD